MHIAFLNWRDLEHPEAGGAEIYCHALAELFVAHGARVTLLTARPGGQPEATCLRGVQVRRAGGRFSVYPRALLWLRQHRREVDAVVDCQNGIPFFSPLVAGRGMPIVQVVHHVHQQQFPLYFPPLAARAGQFLEGRGSRASYRRRPLAVVSPSTRAAVREQLGLTGPRFLVPNGVVLPDIVLPRSRSERPTIVSVGRLVPHKRYRLLIEALPEVLRTVPDLTVHLVGDGPELQPLQQQAAGLPPGAVRWHGRLPDDERDRLLSRAWLSVNPTHGEGWGLSVIEAAAWGVPTVAFRVPGIQDAVLAGRTGWLVPAGGSLGAALGEALAELRDLSGAGAIARACRDWAAGFSWERSWELLRAVLDAEAAFRRGRYPERRRPDVTLAYGTVPPDSFRTGSAPGLRRTDLVRPLASGGFEVLLYGTDLDGLAQALARCGSPIENARLATDADLLAAIRGGPDLAGHPAGGSS